MKHNASMEMPTAKVPNVYYYTEFPLSTKEVETGIFKVKRVKVISHDNYKYVTVKYAGRTFSLNRIFLSKTEEDFETASKNNTLIKPTDLENIPRTIHD